MNRQLEVFVFFTRLGATAFGGPAAHIAMMEDEFVRRRAWITRERFLDLFGTANLLPGPTSTEMALLLGRERGGWIGLLLAGAGFILPAFFMVVAIAAFFAAGGERPGLLSAMRGMQPVIVAVIAKALINLSKTAFKKRHLIFCGIVAAAASILDAAKICEIKIAWILLGTGALNLIVGRVFAAKKAAGAAALAVVGQTFLSATSARRVSAEEAASVRGAASVALPASAALGGAWSVFVSFLKIGAVFYGSGYVLISFLHEEFVVKHLITEEQLNRAILVGQFTPGPFFSSSAFVGYHLHGFAGAAAATAGLFGPAFLYVAVSGLIMPRLRRSYWAALFLDGINAASVALMILVCWQFGQNAVVDWKTALLGVLSFLILLRYKINSAWLVLAGAVVGWLVLR
ncbi:MAG TPA: chromate efflux transporter [Planctomycetota bacterium]|nr:chromate efflux transporter [Planctomycetota bacterium]